MGIIAFIIAYCAYLSGSRQSMTKKILMQTHQNTSRLTNDQKYY